MSTRPPPSSHQHAVELHDVRVVRGGRTSLQITSLAIRSGELVAIVGPNGSGKSTLLRVINGLLPTVGGEVFVLGERLQPATALGIRRRCALVFQDPLLLHATVFDNVALAPRFRGHDRSRVQAQVQAALGAFRCEHLASRPAHQLSGGEVRRVCLARALVCNPELVMLDEPFSALDSPTRSALVRELRDIAVERGTTVLLVTHDFDDVLSFANRAIVLRGGNVVQDAPPQRVLRQPVDEVVARLVSMDNVIACETAPDQDATRVTLPNGATFHVGKALAAGTTTCCLPGDAVILGRDASSEARVRMNGRVVHVIPGVGTHRVALDCEGIQIVARVDHERAQAWAVGEQVDVSFDPSSAHFV